MFGSVRPELAPVAFYGGVIDAFSTVDIRRQRRADSAGVSCIGRSSAARSF
jgi:hypothetical protein